jgi:hypothetical protein
VLVYFEKVSISDQRISMQPVLFGALPLRLPSVDD